jgi:hypothetical protein
MRKNMKIPREEENPEQPVIISKITRSNQAEEMEVMMKNSV